MAASSAAASRSTGSAALLTATLGGPVFALAAPPTDLYASVFVGLGLLYLAVAAASTAKRASVHAFVWATSAGLVGLAFVPGVIHRFTPAGMAGGVVALGLLAAFQALAWAAGLGASHWLSARSGLDPRLAFGGGVLAAVSFPAVLAWTPAGLLSPWPSLVQLADTIGERGVTVVLAVAAALFAEPLRPLLEGCRRPARASFIASPLGGAVLLVVVALYGQARIAGLDLRRPSLATLQLGVVQGAVPARLRWEPSAREAILARLQRLTAQAEARGAELTLWPEAAYPWVLPHAAAAMPRGPLGIVGSGVRGPVVFGALTQPAGERGRYNAATLVDVSGRMQLPQAKLALLWFGETVPLAERIPALRRIFFRAGGLLPGDRVSLLEHGVARIGVLNCYEDTLPAIGRRIALAEPNLLVNLTNDAWFGATSEPELHLRLAALRAIEARRDLVRAVNLGVPAWIDWTGRVRARGSRDRESVLLVPAALNDESPTFYAKVGDVTSWLALLAATLVAAARLRRRTRAPLTEPGPSSS